jgi:capsule polysaccharide export protein KpsE/RkpR
MIFIKALLLIISFNLYFIFLRYLLKKIKGFIITKIILIILITFIINLNTFPVNELSTSFTIETLDKNKSFIPFSTETSDVSKQAMILERHLKSKSFLDSLDLGLYFINNLSISDKLKLSLNFIDLNELFISKIKYNFSSESEIITISLDSINQTKGFDKLTLVIEKLKEFINLSNKRKGSLSSSFISKEISIQQQKIFQLKTKYLSFMKKYDIVDIDNNIKKYYASITSLENQKNLVKLELDSIRKIYIDSPEEKKLLDKLNSLKLLIQSENKKLKEINTISINDIKLKEIELKQELKLESSILSDQIKELKLAKIQSNKEKFFFRNIDQVHLLNKNQFIEKSKDYLSFLLFLIIIFYISRFIRNIILDHKL